ncbi:MAG TPA: aldehyde dehydrogenase family protein [Mycobacteriales bacterium]|nr:aldehyde dehydrogenase family protein [Mycobacteriales bacterium]
MERAELTSYAPASGDVIGRFPNSGPPEVAAAVEQARAAGDRWWRQGYDRRRESLHAFAGHLIRSIDKLAGLVHRETGKPLEDARLEVVISVDHLRWAATHAERILHRSRRLPGLLMANVAAAVEYHPYGVVGVIGPWNYPLFTPMGSIAYALAAGNAVVFKPSEFTPAVGVWLAEAWSQVVPDLPALQVVTGDGRTGAELPAAGVDKVAFTGSTATAKRVMAACAETLTPVLLECGGKDPLIVAPDADLDGAVDAALWGGFTNAGQTCVGVERVFVVEELFEEFLRRLADRARALRPDVDYGPMTMPGQLDVVRGQVTDALARGGRAVVGGEESFRPPYVDPIVLVDVPLDAPAARDETFGPTLTVHRVSTVDDAVTAVNSGPLALGATVFSDRSGEQIARRLRAGMVSINSVISFVAIPALPFGGIGASGFGRIHGPEGLREFARTQALARQRTRSPLPVMTFSRKKSSVDRLVRIVQRMYGRR